MISLLLIELRGDEDWRERPVRLGRLERVGWIGWRSPG